MKIKLKGDNKDSFTEGRRKRAGGGGGTMLLPVMGKMFFPEMCILTIETQQKYKRCKINSTKRKKKRRGRKKGRSPVGSYFLELLSNMTSDCLIVKIYLK